MCEPATIAATVAFISAHAATAAAVISATSAVAGGVMQNQQAQYSAKVQEQNATIAQHNAALTLQAGQDEQRRQYQRVAAVRSQQIAAFAAQGFDTSFGSPADLVKDTSVGGEADAQRLRNQNTAQANSFLLDASNYRAGAAGDRAAGRAALVKGVLDAGSTALTAASRIKAPGGSTAASVGGGGGGNTRDGWSQIPTFGKQTGYGWR